MRLKKETLTAGICTAIIMLILAGIIPVWVHRHGDNSRRQAIDIDWEKAYPFEDKNKTENGNEKTFLDQYQNKIGKMEKRIEAAINENTIFRYPLSEIYCSLEKGMGLVKIVSADQSVIVLDEGYFSYSHEKVDTDVTADKVKNFQNSLAKHDIDFLYVMAPDKCSETDENSIYKGYIDYTEENAEKLSIKLQEREVNFLNLQERAADQGSNVKDFFFKTDHHWKPNSALWGAKKVAEELNENYGFCIDTMLYSQENFDARIYEDIFLGSQGKKVTLAYAEPENIEILSPIYETNLHVAIPKFGLNLTGTFEETFIDQMQLAEGSYPEKYYELNRYAAYGYGDQPLITVKNLQISDGKKVLMVKDSFAGTLAPFLSLGLSDMAIIDLRHFTESLQCYIEEYDPDMAIILMSGGTQHDVYEDFDEHKNLYDFR